MKKKINLLILTSYFPDSKNNFIGGIFIKNQLEYIKKEVNYVNVIAAIPYIPKIFLKFPVFKHRKLQTNLNNYTYDNVSVHFIYYFYIPIGFFRKISRYFLYKKIEKYIKTKKLKFDLIHSHFSHPAGYLGTELKKKFQKPLILTVHESTDLLLKEIKSKDSMLEKAWKEADYIIRVNKSDIVFLKKFNKKIVNIPNGFDEKKIKPIDKDICRKKLGLNERIKIIFTLGGLVKQKGHIYAIEAIKYLENKKVPNFIYFIGGSGNLKNSLEEKIKKLGLEEKIKLIGFIPEEKISLWMNAIDIFVLPSLYEGNPTVMFEALGCGKPFVGSRVGGVSEIIINDNIGLISKPRNSKDLSEKIFLALNKKWNNRFIANYAKQFTWRNICKKIVKIYERCLYGSCL